MKSTARSLLFLSVMICTSLGAGQRHGFPKPPEPAEKASTSGDTKPRLQHRVEPLQLQREAREISDLAHTLPGDIDNVNRGLLPRDVIEKLKRIEKLSKQLRGELAP
jgi:hypothetical protein